MIDHSTAAPSLAEGAKDWPLNDPSAMASIKRGLEQSDRGEVVYMGSFAFQLSRRKTECRGVHSRPCKHCPSKGGATDPEVDDILTWPKERQWETVFPCGFRPSKLCRGYVDTVGMPLEMAQAFHLPAEPL